jgi:hypothetical protein
LEVGSSFSGQIQVTFGSVDKGEQGKPDRGWEMEISPIAGIRVMPVVKVPPADSDLSRVFDIENSSKPDEDTYSGGGKKASGGQDDENEDDELVEEGVEEESHGPAVGRVEGRQVDYFA